MQALKGKVALVAGATRGAGRGIARELGAAGATVYCTGRSVRGKPALDNRPETIEETAEMISAAGGTAIALQVDHTNEKQVEELISRLKAEQGRLDILVNDIWGGESLSEWGKPFWELSLEKGFLMQERAIHTHIITSHYAVPLMLESGQGLIIEITDGDTYNYRGNLFYDLAKISVMRLAVSMAEELKPYNITALSLTPGFLRSEEMLDHFGVTEANWRDGAKQDPHFIASETPHYVGRAVAALAGDPEVFKKTGGHFSTWKLSEEYNFLDLDGSQPHWGRYFEENVKDSIASGV
ncbi:MAG TPA: SDR family oxidoreductase [Chloroflexia bacterium]|nr:SDR family oxidoreductase [Chloroflexia bacterium]